MVFSLYTVSPKGEFIFLYNHPSNVSYLNKFLLCSYYVVSIEFWINIELWIDQRSVGFVEWRELLLFVPGKPYPKERAGRLKKWCADLQTRIGKTKVVIVWERVCYQESTPTSISGSVLVLRVTENFLNLWHNKEVVCPIWKTYTGEHVLFFFVFVHFCFISSNKHLWSICLLCVNQCARYSKWC